MRIAVARCAHESNMFSSRRTTLEMFKNQEYLWGDDLIARHGGMRTYVGGMLDEARDRGIEVVPTISISMSASPLLEAAAFDVIARDFLAAIERAGPVDAICVAMHGAMAAENQLDPEGYLLSQLRARYGPKMPIAVTLDIHTNMSDTMVKEADGLFGSKQYPEIDSYERGREAVAFLSGVVRDGVRPVRAHRYLPLQLQRQRTSYEPAKSLQELCRAQEHGSVLNCTIYFGYGYADVPFLGTHVVALANGDQEAAELAAETVAASLWERKHEFYGTTLAVEDAVAQAVTHEGQPVVIAEASDNPGGGVYGDATSLLRAMLDQADAIRPAAFAFITDPETVNQAWETGVGGRFTARIGGKSPDAYSDPIVADAEVKALSEGSYVLSGPMRPGSRVEMGRTALLTVKGIDVVIGSHEAPTQVFDEEPFRLHGIEPSQCKVVGLKSSNHFMGAYAPIASLVLTASGNGPLNPEVRVYSQLIEPLWRPD